MKGFVVVVMFLLSAVVHGGRNGSFVLRKPAAGLDPGSNLVSNGVESNVSEGFIAKVFSGWERKDLGSSTCDETYGFMPCTTTAVGNLFLLLVYGYLMYLAAKFMTDGSELLLVVLGPGIVGGLLLPILGAFPDALLILVYAFSTRVVRAMDHAFLAFLSMPWNALGRQLQQMINISIQIPFFSPKLLTRPNLDKKLKNFMERFRRHAIKGFIVVVVLLLCAGVHVAGKDGFVLRKSAAGLDCGANLVSDGGDGKISEGFIEKVSAIWKNRDLESSSCEETYGFMPCTTSALGNLFLLAAYGYLMYLAAKFMSDGSEELLTVTGPGIIGGLFLPVLGAFPDALLVLVSGLSGSTETAQSQVLIGMGLLAGSTVMLLTVLWGSCLVVGKCDFSDNSVAIDSQDTRRCSLFESGISTDKSTSTASRIMVASVIPFLIVQIPQIFNSSSTKRIAVLVACIAAILCLLTYCIYQVIQPWIQDRRLEYAKHKHIVSSVLHHVHKKGLGSLLQEDGQLDVDVTKRIFDSLDSDGDKHLSEAELRGLVIGLELHQQSASAKDAVDKILAEFDTSRDGKLDLKEFEDGMRSWLNIAHSSVDLSNNYSKKISDLERTTRDELDNLLPEDTKVDNPYKFYLKAASLMLGGAVLAGIFADPFVDAVDNFSDATSIPSFFISFIAMPLATNSSEGVSALIFASRKKVQTASLTYSEIYGAVTMNNTLCLGIFLAIVYLRDLEWDFSAEVLVILLVVLVMGLFGSFRTTFPLWMSSVAFIMYPLTLAIVYVLDYVLGWS